MRISDVWNLRRGRWNPGRPKDMHPVVLLVGDEYDPPGIDIDPVDREKQSVTIPRFTERTQERPLLVEELDSSVAITDVDDVCAVDRDRVRIGEFPITRA